MSEQSILREDQLHDSPGASESSQDILVNIY